MTRGRGKLLGAERQMMIDKIMALRRYGLMSEQLCSRLGVSRALLNTLIKEGKEQEERKYAQQKQV